MSPVHETGSSEGEHHMATGMTKTGLTRHMAEKLELTNKQSAAFLDLLAEKIGRAHG